MNILFTFLFLFHTFRFLERWFPIGKKEKTLIYLGAISPLGDQILRIIKGEFLFHIEGLLFHSFYYQGLFWMSLTFLYYVYSKNLMKSLTFLLPLLGLFLYGIVCLFSTGNEYFLYPFSLERSHLNWIPEGLFLPTLVLLGIAILSRFFRENFLSATALGLTFLFFISMGGIQYRVQNKIPQEELQQAEHFFLFPKNIWQNQWNIITYYRGEYKIRDYDLFEDHLTPPSKKSLALDFDLAQSLLLDPIIQKLVLYVFRNPILNIKIQNEVLSMEITEALPLNEFFWISKIELKKRRTGQIFAFQTSHNFFNYGFFE